MGGGTHRKLYGIGEGQRQRLFVTQREKKSIKTLREDYGLESQDQQGVVGGLMCLGGVR